SILSLLYHASLSSSFFLLLRPPPCATLFPYTTLFRSVNNPSAQNGAARGGSASAFAIHAARTQARGFCHSAKVPARRRARRENRSEEHTSELQSRGHLVCRLLLEKKKKKKNKTK